MSNPAVCSSHACTHLRREVDALELLVDRYQQELAAHATCSACGRVRGQSLQPVEEELFEQQQLNATQWTGPANTTTGATLVPFLTRRSGERCSFEDVQLPSGEWKWTSDWRVDVHTNTDVNGWTYAMSTSDFDAKEDCRVERHAEERVRRRRWKRQRKFVGSSELPPSVALRLDQERRLCEMQSANEKLTEQLRRANDQILDYEDRLKAYEAKLQELQRSQLHRPPAIKTHAKSASTSSLFSPSKSREVLHQTEALLNQLLGTAPVLEEGMREAQRRRSQMVLECQSELDGAVDEFQSLVHTLDARPA